MYGERKEDDKVAEPSNFVVDETNNITSFTTKYKQDDDSYRNTTILTMNDKIEISITLAYPLCAHEGRLTY